MTKIDIVDATRFLLTGLEQRSDEDITNLGDYFLEKTISDLDRSLEFLNGDLLERAEAMLARLMDLKG